MSGIVNAVKSASSHTVGEFTRLTKKIGDELIEYGSQTSWKTLQKAMNGEDVVQLGNIIIRNKDGKVVNKLSEKTGFFGQVTGWIQHRANQFFNWIRSLFGAKTEMMTLPGATNLMQIPTKLQREIDILGEAVSNRKLTDNAKELLKDTLNRMKSVKEPGEALKKQIDVLDNLLAKTPESLTEPQINLIQGRIDRIKTRQLTVERRINAVMEGDHSFTKLPEITRQQSQQPGSALARETQSPIAGRADGQITQAAANAGQNIENTLNANQLGSFKEKLTQGAKLSTVDAKELSTYIDGLIAAKPELTPDQLRAAVSARFPHLAETRFTNATGTQIAMPTSTTRIRTIETPLKGDEATKAIDALLKDGHLLGRKGNQIVILQNSKGQIVVAGTKVKNANKVILEGTELVVRYPHSGAERIPLIENSLTRTVPINDAMAAFSPAQITAQAVAKTS